LLIYAIISIKNRGKGRSYGLTTQKKVVKTMTYNFETDFPTFGVEWEWCNSRPATINANDDRRIKARKEAFNQAGERTHGFKAYRNGWNHRDWARELTALGFDWVFYQGVDRNSSPESTQGIACEATSPPFSILSMSAATDIKRFLNAIESFGGRGWHQYRFEQEYKAGMHCHIGNAWILASHQSPDQHWHESKRHMAASKRHYSGAVGDIIPLELAKDVITRFAGAQHDACLPYDRRQSSGNYGHGLWPCTDIRHVAENGQGHSDFWNSDTPAGAARILGRYGSSEKFAAVSLDTWSRLGTVEFRQHHTTLNVDKLWHWLNLIDNTFRTSAKNRINWQAIGQSATPSVVSTPEQLFRSHSRLGLIYTMIRREGGATTQDLVNATGIEAQSIRARMTEIRNRLSASGVDGQAALVTHTQQAYGNAYGASQGRHDLNGYEVLREVATAPIRLEPVLPENARGPASLWHGLSDQAFEYFQGRQHTYRNSS